jgi:hypothetical protein
MGDNTDDFLDCYEVNDNDVTHKSTRSNEGDKWFFGLLPKSEEKGGSLSWTIGSTITLVVVLSAFLLFIYNKYFEVAGASSNRIVSGGAPSIRKKR